MTMHGTDQQGEPRRGGVSGEASAGDPRLATPEWIEEWGTLTPAQLRAARAQLERELDAPQTRTARARKQAALERIVRSLGGAAVSPPRRSSPRSPGPGWARQARRGAPTRRPPPPDRALDAMLARLEGWSVDPDDAEAIERAGVPSYGPGRAAQLLRRAMEEGRIAGLEEVRDPAQLHLRLMA